MTLPQHKSHYPFVLDHKPGLLLSRILYALFKRVRFDANMTQTLKQMHRKGTVIYAIKYRGYLDCLLYHYRFRTGRIPYPKIIFDMNMLMFMPLSHVFKTAKFYMLYFFKNKKFPNPYKTGFFKTTIQHGTSSLLFLVDPKGFKRRFIHAQESPIHFLLKTQKDTDRPIYIVPQLILYKTTPEKDRRNIFDIFFGYKDNPGLFSKLVLFFRHYRQAFIDFGTPVDLRLFLDSQPNMHSLEELSSEIKQTLIESIDKQKRIILGPVQKSRQQLKEKVLKDQRILQHFEKRAVGDPKHLKQIKKNAAQIFDEIAADYSAPYIQFFYNALTWLWKKIFEEIDVNPVELGLVREWARRGPLIYIPSHKSHIDYLVFNYVLYQNHMHTPRIAAGKNLSFWPFGYFFRKSGAFFIRRTFKGSALYPQVFARYVEVLLEEGYPLEFFIEGGRSRSGKLVFPKTGFLSILLQAYREGFCDELIFVPASITYDRILEEKAHLKELGGGTKEKESLKQVLTAGHFLKRKHGKVYIRFGQPFSIKDNLGCIKDHEGPDICKPLAYHLIQSINQVTLVTPQALIATAILTKHRRGFQLHELAGTVNLIMSFLKTYHIQIATTLDHPEQAIEEALALLVNRKLVSTIEDVDGDDIFYYVDESKKLELEYYKNSIIHYFIPHAFVAVSLLRGTKDIITSENMLADYHFMKNVFNNEFIYNEQKDDIESFNDAVKYFQDQSFIIQKNTKKGFSITRAGFDDLPVWAALAKTFLESYWIATRAVIRQHNRVRKRSELLKNMYYLGLRFHKLGIIDHAEAISKINFENALYFITSIHTESENKLGENNQIFTNKLHELTQKLYDLCHFTP